MHLVIELDFVGNIGQKRANAIKEIIRIPRFNRQNKSRYIKFRSFPVPHNKRQQSFDKAFLYFDIRIIQSISIKPRIIALYRQITALIDNRQRVARKRCNRRKRITIYRRALKLVDIRAIFLQQLHQKCRRSRLIPVMMKFLLGQRIEQTVRIIDTLGHVFTKMITIIFALQKRMHLIIGLLLIIRHALNIFMKYAFDLNLGHATYSCIFPHQRDISNIIKRTEYAQFPDFRHARQQHEFQIPVTFFDAPIKAVQCLAVLFLQCFVIQRVQYRLFVFIHQQYGWNPQFFRGATDYPHKAIA